MEKNKILVVDDEFEIDRAIQLILGQQDGYEVLVASDGEEALDKARKEKPDLIVLDLMLPKINGYKVCRMLKFDQAYSKIPIIMLTAKARKSDLELGYEVGADAYITKPFEPVKLLAKVEELLSNTK